MNPFQRARAEANSYRALVLGENADHAVSADTILADFEEKLDLGVEPVPRGSNGLGTSDACLRRNEKFIYVCRDVTDEEHIELVSHELGHWALDAQKSPTVELSTAKPTDLGDSPGVVAVEAYGARERQELQANVFAREFMLPRRVARELFVSGQGARQTAEKLGLPLKAVRQQMVDSVLLPAAPDAPTTPLFDPSPDQEKAAQATERFANVVAGPGTGKTSTLIHRVKYLIDDRGIDPSQILALTFTNKAAFELVERLRATGLDRAADIWAGTFHAFGLEFLRKYHDALGLDSNIIVADRLTQITLLANNLQGLPLKRFLRVEDPYDWLGNIVSGIGRLKEELVTPEQYRSRLKELDPTNSELGQLREDAATVYEAYEELLDARKLVDFVDLVSIPTVSIREDRERFSDLANRFQYILVDEYQDVTEAMVHLIRQLAKTAESLWVVGDVRQAIHHWRGASVKSMLRFEQLFGERASEGNNTIRKYPLKTNRRSTQEIVDLLSHCGRVHVLEDRLPLDETTSFFGPSGFGPTLVACPSRLEVSEAIGLVITHLKEKGIEFSDQAILCRKSSDVEFLAGELRDKGVPVLYIGELTTRPEVSQLLCLMQLLTERQPRALIGLNKTCDLNVPIEDLQVLLDNAKKQRSWQRGRWLSDSTCELPESVVKGAQTLANLVEDHSWHSAPWDFLCDVLLEKRFGMPSLDDESIDAHVSRIAIWQFLNSTLGGDGDGKKPTLHRFVSRLQLRSRIGDNYVSRELPPEAEGLDAVRLQTVHSSKGLEYAAVHVGFVDRDSYGDAAPNWRPLETVTDIVPPEVLGSSDEEYEFEQAVERNNLLYVAVSRAKHRLVLYEDKSWPHKPPPQLVGIEVPISRKPYQRNIPEKENAALETHPIDIESSLSYPEFATYVRCPLEHWYRHGAGLWREQETHVSARARLAVLAALRDFAEGKKVETEHMLSSAWSASQLPDKEEDPLLWKDANKVFSGGMTMLTSFGGSFQQLEASVNGITIQLPWMTAKSDEGGTELLLIQFFPREALSTKTLISPMLCGQSEYASPTLTIRNLLTDSETQALPSRNVSMTKAAAAVEGMKAGDRSPKPGRHCRYCAYQTICPAKPI